MSFGGTFRHQIDEKNRMRIPAKLREKLGERYVVTCGTDGCLFVFPSEYFDNVFAPMLEGLPMTDPNARKILRFFMANKYDVEEDKQGRFVIPEELMKFARIQKNLVTTGSGTRIEIWNSETYDAYNDLDNFDAAFAELAKYNK